MESKTHISKLCLVVVKTMVVTRRKHRNQEEREAIAQEALQSLCRLQIDEDHPAVLELKSAIERFRGLERGRIHGQAEVPEMKCLLEYELPTRRIMRHWVRCTSKK